MGPSYPAAKTYLTLCIYLKAVGLVLGLEPEVLMRRSKEHVTRHTVSNYRAYLVRGSYLILIQSR